MNRSIRTILFVAGLLVVPSVGSVIITDASLATVSARVRHYNLWKWHDPYIGEWSNGRGERLVITSGSIKYGRDKAVPYTDLTRVTNGREFNLQITAEGKLNYFTEFLHISVADGDKSDEMKMTLFNSRKDMEEGKNSQGEATWDRDK